MICNLLPGRNLSSNTKDGLNNILAAVETSEQEYIPNPIILFKNDKYVCTYDMVRSMTHRMSFSVAHC